MAFGTLERRASQAVYWGSLGSSGLAAANVELIRVGQALQWSVIELVVVVILKLFRAWQALYLSQEELCWQYVADRVVTNNPTRSPLQIEESSPAKR